MMNSKRLKVTRTLTYEGNEDWINEILNRSYIRIGEFKLDLGIYCTIEETDRVTEQLD